MCRKFPGGVENTKQNSSPDSVSRPGCELDISEIQVISLNDKSNYSVTEQVRCLGLLFITGFNNKFLPEFVIKYGGADKSLARPGMKQATTTEDFDIHISYLLS